MGIEGDVILDPGDGVKRGLIGPHGIDRAFAAQRDAVVSAVTLVGAVGGVSRAFEERHVDILSRDVLHWRVSRLAERRGLAGVGDGASPTDTTTRERFTSIVIGWSAPGTLIGLDVMARILYLVSLHFLQDRLATLVER